MTKKKSTARILAGSLRHKSLPSPRPIKGKSYVTPQKLKEAVFNIIESRHPSYGNMIFYDLFAGSCQMGFEAISRGALHTVFCDVAAERLEAGKKFLRDIDLQARASFYRGNALKILGRAMTELPPRLEPGTVKPADTNLIIFADPPYTYEDTLTYKRLLQTFRTHLSELTFGSALMLVQAPKFAARQFKEESRIYDYGKNCLLLVTSADPF